MSPVPVGYSAALALRGKMLPTVVQRLEEMGFPIEVAVDQANAVLPLEEAEELERGLLAQGRSVGDLIDEMWALIHHRQAVVEYWFPWSLDW